MSIIPVITPGMKRLQSITPERAGVPQEQPEEEKPGILGRAAQLMQGYVEGVADPVAGAAAYMFSPSVRESYEEARAEGEGRSRASGAGWREGLTDTPSIKFDLRGQGIPLPFGKRFDEFQLGLKGAAELVLDPLNLLPGVGYGGQIIKGVGKATGRNFAKSTIRETAEAAATDGTFIGPRTDFFGPNLGDFTPKGHKIPLGKIHLDDLQARVRKAEGSTGYVRLEKRQLYIDEIHRRGAELDPPRNARKAAEQAKGKGEGSKPRDPVDIAADEELITRWTNAIKDAPLAQAVRKALIRDEQNKRITRFGLEREEFMREHPDMVLSDDELAELFGGLKGEIATPAFDAPQNLFNKQEIKRLEMMIQEKFKAGTIRDYDFINARSGFEKLFTHGQVPTPRELRLLKEVFGDEFAQAAFSKRGGKWKERLIAAWNVPKTFLASMDLSAPLRQGALLLPEGSPWFKSFWTMIKSLRSEKNVDALYAGIRESDEWPRARALGLDITFPDESAFGLAGREEAFLGAGIAERIWVAGPLVRLSNRSYTAFLNKLRWDTYLKQLELLGPTNKRTGLMGEGATVGQIRDLTRNINILSGRATISGVSGNKLAVLNGMFFSPRFVWSRIQAPTLLIRQALAEGADTPAGRQLSRMVARDMLGYMSGVLGMLYVGKASGVIDVELDPRSSDWGKAKYENIRIDPWAGLQQPMRALAQSLTGERKQMGTGKIQDVTVPDVISTFVESKAHPTLSSILDMQSGTTFTGEDITPGGMFLQNFIPLVFQDAKEIYDAEGVGSTASILPLGFFGMSVYNIPDKYGTGNADVDEELQRMGMYIHRAGNTIDNIELSKEQHSEYEDLTRARFAQLMEARLGDSLYKSLSEQVVLGDKSPKQEAIQRIMDASRAYARGKMRPKVHQRMQGAAPQPSGLLQRRRVENMNGAAQAPPTSSIFERRRQSVQP